MANKRGPTTKYQQIDWPHLVWLYQQPSRRRLDQPTSATELWDYAKARYGLGDRSTFIGHLKGHLAAAGVRYRTHAESKPGRVAAVDRMRADELPTWLYEFGNSAKKEQQK
ncbi:MAG: hypothetical protein KDE47_00775 [Caldilineaceae bacterium]|nr:hypothetical protein [Caldilineaceae bacterium]